MEGTGFEDLVSPGEQRCRGSGLAIGSGWISWGRSAWPFARPPIPWNRAPKPAPLAVVWKPASPLPRWLQFKPTPGLHRRIERLQGAAAGIDLIVMGEVGEAAPASTRPSSSTRTGIVHPHLRMAPAILSRSASL
jgi:hypothetical protein